MPATFAQLLVDRTICAYVNWILQKLGWTAPFGWGLRSVLGPWKSSDDHVLLSCQV